MSGVAKVVSARPCMEPGWLCFECRSFDRVVTCQLPHGHGGHCWEHETLCDHCKALHTQGRRVCPGCLGTGFNGHYPWCATCHWELTVPLEVAP